MESATTSPKGSGLRIFAVFFHPSSDFTAVGGAEKRFLQILKVWDRIGVAATVVESGPRLVSSCCPSLATREITSPISAYGKGLFSIYLEWILWVAKACIRCPGIAKEKRQDVILSPNNTLPNLFVAYFVHAVSRLPLVVTVHHFDFPHTDVKANIASAYHIYRDVGFGKITSLVKALTFFMMLALVKRADRLITVSNHTARFLRTNNISNDKISVSGNGIDTEQIAQSKAKKEKYEGVFVGRISRDKGVFDLVTIWKLIVNERPESRLLMVGKGPDMARLEELVKQNDLCSNIILTGSLNDRRLYAVMKASRVFLFPSRFEGWGLAVGEALASGLPVVCYDLPALREIFGECKSVFFVESNDTAGFAKFCENIVFHGDPDRFRTISEEYARRFDWKKAAAADLQFIAFTSTSRPKTNQ